MRGKWSVLVLGLVACGGNGDGNGDGTDTDDGNPTDGCAVPGPALPNLFAELDGIDHACEDAAEYNPDVATATSYWIGEFDLDACGEVRGHETWVLFANPRWEELGGYDCQIVWSVSGTKHDPTSKGTYGLTLNANIDESLTDCPTDQAGTPIYAGDTSVVLEYDVEVRNDGTSVFYFAGSGSLLGEGYANEGHVSYLSELDCLLF